MKNPQTIRIIGASAGTGKTTRLSREFVDGVSEGGAVTTTPEKILVSTFTIKAAEELTSRIRQTLISKGQWTAAQLVRAGYVGTVNAICGKILQDYALQGGLSPVQNVIPEQMEKAIFSIAVDPVIDVFAQEIDEIAARLSFDELPRGGRFAESTHWTSFVADVCRLARANRIDPKRFSECAEKSWLGLERCLPTVYEIAPEELDKHFLEALQSCINALEALNDSAKKTQAALEKLKEVYARSKRRSLSWYDWATVSKIDVSKASADCVRELCSVACLHPRHPRLREDLRTFIYSVFACAAESLQAYQDYKMAAGLIDFTDQEYRALELLEDTEVSSSLSSRIELALIDEFQDTSPIQLALFLRLASITKSSVWVGDIKQAIYGFRGTDPLLMQAATKAFAEDSAQNLDVSYRSRPMLVDFSNQVFAAAFSPFGITETEVSIKAYRTEIVGGPLPVLELWKCNGQKLTDCYGALASGVSEFISNAHNLSVVDKDLGHSRPLKPADIAILCRANDRAEGIAQALISSGLKVAITTDGLLETPECILAIAAIRYLLDKNDRLALAEMIHLSKDYSQCTQDSWLDDWLSSDNPESLFPYSEEFQQTRSKLPTLTAIESLQFALTAGNVLEIVASWGNIRQRYSNIDALRGLVIDYESVCTMQKSAASAAGFINYLDRLRESRKPASSDDDAVQVITYHGSKGLEWPVVILTDLDKSSSPTVARDLCSVNIETDKTQFDATDPLKDRWIRFWPWPYGKQEQAVHLDVSAAASPEYAALSTRLRAESIRLLYVGLTRARELLIFAPYTGRRGQDDGLDWVKDLQDQNQQAILNFPDTDGIGIVTVSGADHRIMVRNFTNTAFDSLPESSGQTLYRFLSDRERKEYPPLILKPSQIASLAEPQEVAKTQVFDIGQRIPITGLADMQVIGDCLHKFLGSDEFDAPLELRLTRADRLRDFWSVFQISAESMVEMSDRLNSFITQKFGECIWYRECPITGRLGNQRVHGVIDLLLETSDAFYIFDHKSFPGSGDKWVDKAQSFTEQLKLYSTVINHASNKPVRAMYIHLPVVGKVVEL